MLQEAVKQPHGATVFGYLVKDPERFGVVEFDADQKAISIEEKPENPISTKASMGIYIFSWQQLREYLIRDEENQDSEKDFGKNIIPMMLNEGKNIYAYPFYGYWKDVGTIESLWEANMDLIKNKENFNIDDRLWRIYYRHEGAMPQYLGHSANVKNSMISDGTAVYGTVSESIISSGVRIEEGAEIVGSIIMKDVLIEKGAKVYNSIIAEGSIVKENVEVGHRDITLGKEQITVIGRDEVVKDNRKVEGK